MMNKRLGVFLLVGGVLIGLGIWFRAANRVEDQYFPPLRPMSEGEVFEYPEPAETGPPRLAVGYLGLESAGLSSTLADVLLAELAGVEGLELVERSQLNSILSEMELSLSGRVDSGTLVEIGRLARATHILIGTSSGPQNDEVLFKIVDVRTGVLQGLSVVARADADLAGTASRLKDLVELELLAEDVQARTYLAFGGFEDLSLNDRRSGFAEELRSRIAAAYGGSDVTVLDRETIEEIMDEQSLIVAGITEDGASPRPLRSAAWYVDGVYQSLESSEDDVELIVRITRIRGTTFKEVVRGPVNGEFFDKVKFAIDSKVNLPAGQFRRAPRNHEVEEHMKRGRELARLENSAAVTAKWISMFNSPGGGGNQFDEAIKEFQTAILLDPEYLEAKLYLFACLSDPRVRRYKEAEGLIREVVLAADDPAILAQARMGLMMLKALMMDTEALSLLAEVEAMELSDFNKSYLSIFKSRVQERMFWAGGVDVDSHRASIVDELIRNLSEARTRLNETGKVIIHGASIRKLMRTYGEREGGDWMQRASEVLSRVRSEFPELFPYVLAEAITRLPNGDNDVVSEFRSQLDEFSSNPDGLRDPASYFSIALQQPRTWAFDAGDYELAIEIFRARERAGELIGLDPPSDHQRVGTAYAYAALKDWDSALRILDSFGPRTAEMGGNGPWGSYKEPFLPAFVAAKWRLEQGVSDVPDSRFFLMGEPQTNFGRAFAFALGIDGETLWAAGGEWLLKLSLDPLMELERIRIPLGEIQPESLTVRCMVMDGESVWLGTTGAGVLRIDQTTGDVRAYTVESHGLSMNKVSALYLDDQRLWIGFAGGNTGGVGKLDIVREEYHGFTPSLEKQDLPIVTTGKQSILDRSSDAPRRPVFAIRKRGESEIWIAVVTKGLQRFDEKSESWTTFRVPDAQKRVVTLDLDENIIVAGCRLASGWSTSNPTRGGLSVLDGVADDWVFYTSTDGLPSNAINVVALHKNEIWVGGPGYLAILDKDTREMLRYSQFHGLVRQVVFSEQHAWVTVGGELYKFPVK